MLNNCSIYFLRVLYINTEREEGIMSDSSPPPSTTSGPPVAVLPATPPPTTSTATTTTTTTGGLPPPPPPLRSAEDIVREYEDTEDELAAFEAFTTPLTTAEENEKRAAEDRLAGLQVEARNVYTNLESQRDNVDAEIQSLNQMKEDGETEVEVGTDTVNIDTFIASTTRRGLDIAEQLNALAPLVRAFLARGRGRGGGGGVLVQPLGPVRTFSVPMGRIPDTLQDGFAPVDIAPLVFEREAYRVAPAEIEFERRQMGQVGLIAPPKADLWEEAFHRRDNSENHQLWHKLKNGISFDDELRHRTWKARQELRDTQATERNARSLSMRMYNARYHGVYSHFTVARANLPLAMTLPERRHEEWKTNSALGRAIPPMRSTVMGL